ncbi:MAG: carboxypeptidase regulatory-like domain-containing protein [Minicystis sp.]
MRYRSGLPDVSERSEPTPAAARRPVEPKARVIAFLAAFVCFVFVVTLRDVYLFRPLPPSIPAPLLPSTEGARDAELTVTVGDEAGKPLAGASVRVFAMRAGKAYFAGDRNTDASGRAVFTKLPRGEIWLLGYGAGRARASSKLVLEAGLREATLVLRPAKALDVVVVDESEHPVAGASVEVTTTDPLPYSAVTGAPGTARIDRLGQAPYRVRVWAKGFDEVTKSGVVPGATPLRVRLERPAGINVTVVDAEGKPAAGATVLAAGTGLWPARSTAVDAQGEAHIGGLRGGVYNLKATRGDEVSRTELAVPVKRGEVKDVKLTLEPGRRVRILVTDGDGEGAPPVKDAAVVLAEEGLTSFPIHGRTGPDGVALLGPIARGRASVSARAAGFVARTAAVAETAAEVRVPLLRGGTLAGDVVDDRGYPVGGATIEVIGTDAEGMPIDETSAMIDFQKERFELALPGPAPLIPMGELGVMPGPIPDLPPASAAIAAVDSGTTGQRRGGDPWVTRADGTFRCEPIPPGRVHAIVRHPGYVETISDAVSIRLGVESTVHVVLRQGGWIEGRVLEEDRTPVRGARIELAATHGSLEKVTYAADDGTFTFAAAPDEVLLSVSRPEAPGDVVTRVTVAVPDRDRARVEILLPKPRDPVSVRVVDDRGYPVDRVEVRAISLDLADPLRRTLFTDDRGEATLPGAVGLPLRFTLVRPGKAPLVEVVDNTPAKLTLTMIEGLEGRGNVTARDGRDRVANVDLTLFTSSGARHVRTDAEGAFTVKDLAPGRVRISAHHNDYAPAEVVITVAGDRDHPADLGTIDLEEAGEVEGEVLDADERPVAGARVARDVVPTYLPAGPLPRGIAATDRKGRFKLGSLPEGKIAIEAYFADLGRGRAEDVVVRAGRTTDRVKIILADGQKAAARDPKGAGSIAVTLEEKGDGGGKLVLVALVPMGSEAEAAGLEPGDTIVSINGQAVRSIEAARKLLTGPLGEDVIVEVRRDDATEKSTMYRVRRERVRR